MQGPFADLEEATEKQIRKGVMSLQMLDLRDNRITKMIQTQAVNFLKMTVVLLWGNPFEDNLKDEFIRPKHVF